MKTQECLQLRIENAGLKDDVEMYQHMNEQLLVELEIIKWHIKFLQDGRNAKQILEDYEEVVK